jgi:hypothetical protein
MHFKVPFLLFLGILGKSFFSLHFYSYRDQPPSIHKGLCQAEESPLVEYNVVMSEAGTGIVGVAVGQEVFPLQQHDQAPLLYTGMGPGKQPYRYVLLNDLTSKEMVDFEPFERPAILQSDRTFNEVFGRPWNKLALPTLPKVYPFELGPDTPKNKKHADEDLGHSKLYEDGVIANLMFNFDPALLDQLHSDKMDPLKKIKGTMSYVR